MLSFFPRGVLDEILNLIESVSEEFPSYSYCHYSSAFYLSLTLFTNLWPSARKELASWFFAYYYYYFFFFFFFFFALYFVFISRLCVSSNLVFRAGCAVMVLV